jgi:hypothetical protein
MVCAATPDPGVDGDASTAYAGSMPTAQRLCKPLKEKGLFARLGDCGRQLQARAPKQRETRCIRATSPARSWQRLQRAVATD